MNDVVTGYEHSFHLLGVFMHHQQYIYQIEKEKLKISFLKKILTWLESLKLVQWWYFKIMVTYKPILKVN